MNLSHGAATWPAAMLTYCILQRCPVCNKSTRDMLQHLIVHQRASDEYLCSSPSSQASSSLSHSMSTVSALMLIVNAARRCIHTIHVSMGSLGTPSTTLPTTPEQHHVHFLAFPQGQAFISSFLHPRVPMILACQALHAVTDLGPLLHL